MVLGVGGSGAFHLNRASPSRREGSLTGDLFLRAWLEARPAPLRLSAGPRFTLTNEGKHLICGACCTNTECSSNSVLLKPASASSGNLLKMQGLGQQPKPRDSEILRVGPSLLCVKKLSKGYQFEKRDSW